MGSLIFLVYMLIGYYVLNDGEVYGEVEYHLMALLWLPLLAVFILLIIFVGISELLSRIFKGA